MTRAIPRLSAALAAAMVLSAGCFYTRGTVNMIEFERRGLSFTKAPKSDATLRNFGRVRANARSYLLSDCSQTAVRALDELLAEAGRTGANRVSGVRYRGHWYWMSEPVCRRNLNYLLLIVPAFLPIPTSVTVSGTAIYDPAAAGAD
jgi:hypothetical protein